jgi:outer membrane protein assembly factor BamB
VVDGAGNIGENSTFRSFIVRSGIALADSPWPKFRRDLKNTGQSPYVGAQGGAFKWSYTTGGEVHSSPAVAADGTIYIGSSDNRLYALNPDGTLRWFYQTGNWVHSSPAIGADGTVYFTSFDGKLYALDENGGLKWYFENVFGYCSPAISPDGTVYVGSVVWPASVSLSALYENGDLKWSFNTGLSYIDGYQIRSCPAIGFEGTIYFTVFDFSSWPTGNYGYLYALHENGELKWVNEVGGLSSPAIAPDGTIYVGSRSKLYALNPDNTIKWSHTIGKTASSPAIGADGTIYIGSFDNRLYAINSDNTLKWSYATNGAIWSSPAVGADNTIYVGSSDGKLYAFYDNGTLKWSYTTEGPVESSPVIGGDGTIYVGSNDGKLYAIGQLARFSLVTLYKVRLQLDYYFQEGSKLVIRFYSYSDVFENENVIENFSPSMYVKRSENISHPEKIGVKKVKLDLTYDNIENVILTVASFIVTRDHIWDRIVGILARWPDASPAERDEFWDEIVDILGQWPDAP